MKNLRNSRNLRNAIIIAHAYMSAKSLMVGRKTTKKRDVINYYFYNIDYRKQIFNATLPTENDSGGGFTLEPGTNLDIFPDKLDRLCDLNNNFSTNETDQLLAKYTIA